VSAFCPHILVNCIVNDGLVTAMPNMLQFINVVHPRLIDSLLDDVPYLAVDRAEVKTVRWPQIRWNESIQALPAREVV